MTTQDKTPIRALIEAVGGDMDMSCNDFTTCGILEELTMWRLAYKAYYGSLDAALALHEALLPGQSYGVGDVHAGVYTKTGFLPVQVRGDNPARAWLLAILRAYEAQQ